MSRRIVITGVGIRCSNAVNYDDFTYALCETIPGQSKISLFDARRLNSQIACQIKEELKYRNLDVERLNKIAYEAIDDLLTCRGIPELIKENNEDMIFSYASSLSGIESMMQYVGSDPENEAQNRILAYSQPLPVVQVAQRLGVRCPVYTTMSACASGTAAAGIVIDAIRNGETDVAVVGGADSLQKFSVYGFNALESLSPENCRPFDVNRNGINIGEAAAFMTFEEYEHAVARGAKIYAEVLGYSATDEAYHMTAPQPDGDGIYAVMKAAMRDAGVDFNNEEEIYINTHGTGTMANDEAELKAISRLFVDNTQVYISSTKSVTGHCLGSAGSVELAAALVCLNEGLIPATAHTEKLIETAGKMKIVISKSVEKSVDYVISNSFAFAGNNACIILKKYN